MKIGIFLFKFILLLLCCFILGIIVMSLPVSEGWQIFFDVLCGAFLTIYTIRIVTLDESDF